MKKFVKEQINEAIREFISCTGIGQYTHYGAADWLVENYPNLAVEIVMEYLKRQGEEGK